MNFFDTFFFISLSKFGVFNIGQFFLFFLALAFVVVLAIIVTRFVANQRFRSYNKNIKILESISIGYNSSICIIQIGSKYILVGVTKETVTFLQNINENDIEIVSDLPNYQASFKKYLDKYLIRKGEKDDNEEKE